MNKATYTERFVFAGIGIGGALAVIYAVLYDKFFLGLLMFLTLQLWYFMFHWYLDQDYPLHLEKVQIIEAWYDCWYGLYWDKNHLRMYVMIPNWGLVFKFYQEVPITIPQPKCAICKEDAVAYVTIHVHSGTSLDTRRYDLCSKHAAWYKGSTVLTGALETALVAQQGDKLELDRQTELDERYRQQYDKVCMECGRPVTQIAWKPFGNGTEYARACICGNILIRPATAVEKRLLFGQMAVQAVKSTRSGAAHDSE